MNKVIDSEPTKLWNKSYIFILLISTLNSIAFFMIATILTKYLVRIGVSMSLAGVIVGMFSISSLICRPLCGVMSDRLNNVRLMKWSNILMGIGLVGFVITTNIPLIFLFRILNGVGFAIGGTSQISLATKYIPKNRMGEGIGYMGIGVVIGTAVAPGFGIAIAEKIGLKATFIVAALITVIAYILLLSFKEGKKKETVKIKKISFNDIIAKKAMPYTLIASTFSFINGSISSYLILFAEEHAIEGVSIYFTVCAIVLFVIRPVAGKLMDRKGIKITVLPSLLITASSMFILGRGTSLWIIILTGVLRSIGQGAAQPSLQAGCINEVGTDRSGVATSTYYLGSDIAQGVSPMIGGVVIGQFTGIEGFRTLFDMCGILMLLALVFFFYVTRKKEKISKGYSET